MDIIAEFEAVIDALAERGKDISVVSLGGLAQMKRLAARTQDLADLESLAISDLEPDDG